MELANCMLALGGDSNQTIEKYDVSPAEVAVLRVIHGADAVSSIVVTKTTNRTSGAERGRLIQVYGRGIDGQIRSPAVEHLFPGVAARLFETFDEIEQLDEELELVEEIVTPVEEVVVPVAAKPVRAKKAKAPPVPEPEIEETDNDPLG